MREKLAIIVLALIITSIFQNCKEDKKLSVTEFEQSVFYEIFPSIIDSIHSDMRLIPPPPPPPNVLKEKGYDINNKSDPYNKAYEEWLRSDDYKQTMKTWEKVRDSIVKDTTSYFLVVQDSISSIEKDTKPQFAEHFKEYNIAPDTLDHRKNFALELNKLKTNHKKVKFKYRTEFPEGREFWRNKYKYNVVAYVGFSRILFDKTRTFGVLDGSYSMAPLNGSGYRIFIKKTKDGKWIIDEIIGTWIS
ncbi:hypothetical protein LB465_14040 [Salegentibacter sp. LM13S]|uniref:hypothetical protein n=1 Tax=Salegentibacter lacus TaxID=2873599 RepID=UPI001CCC5F38|nr:hypothetical protein [Salegentibacter lacus]MBZ9631905.1 hypothetical protein [Salegentibacter lacus]